MKFPAAPDSLLELVRAMVRIDTVNGRISGRDAAELPLALALQDLANCWGLAAELLPVCGEQANLLITAFPSGPEKNWSNEPWLLLESHLDTVAVEGMTIEPFAPGAESDRILGRGSCDTKASGAAMLWALREVVASGQLANPTALLFSVDEEVGKGGIHAFAREQLPTLGWRPALALVGEPTLLAPVIAHNGAVRAKLQVRGIPAHSSNPSRGRSAISDMVAVIQELETNYIPALSARHPLTGPAQCSINQIHGGRQANMIPDFCEIVIDRRLVPGEDPHAVLPAWEKHLTRLREQRPGLQVEVTDVLFDPPLAPTGSEPGLDFISPALRALGCSTEPQGMPYGTDAANLAEVGIPAIVIGPGDIAQAHTVDEWIAVDEIHRAHDFFARVLQQPLSPLANHLAAG
jgi:acetylornithine deacetylase